MPIKTYIAECLDKIQGVIRGTVHVLIYVLGCGGQLLNNLGVIMKSQTEQKNIFGSLKKLRKVQWMINVI